MKARRWRRVCLSGYQEGAATADGMLAARRTMARARWNAGRLAAIYPGGASCRPAGMAGGGWRGVKARGAPAVQLAANRRRVRLATRDNQSPCNPPDDGGKCARLARGATGGKTGSIVRPEARRDLAARCGGVAWRIIW